MTRRLYFDDSYLREFKAEVAGVDGNRVYLDQTAFYPSSGGQPFDKGSINGAAVVDVIDEEDRIAHVVENPTASGAVTCSIDWPRRFDHMQQHSGQHLMSAVLNDSRGIATVSFHLGQETSTIDVAGALDASQIEELERNVNREVFANRAITVSYHESGEDMGLRKPSERHGRLRVVSIDGLDRSACGGTHVGSTGEIGPVFIRRLEKIRGNTRIEFVCGERAVRAARADFNTVSQVARLFSATAGETPALVAAQMERLAEADRLRRKLSTELAGFRGRSLYQETAPNGRGIRFHLRRLAGGPIDDELRAEAQAFAAGAEAVFLAVASQPPSLLLAVSEGGLVEAGAVLKPLLERLGGRGGGNARMAQGSLPSREALQEAGAELEAIVDGKG